MESYAEGVDDLEDGGEAGIAFARERHLEAFAPDAGIAGELHHAPGAGDVAENLGDEGCIVASLFHGYREVKWARQLGCMVAVTAANKSTTRKTPTMRPLSATGMTL